MLICLIREVTGSAPAANSPTPGTVFQTTELTIGSAPDQHVQVPHKDVGHKLSPLINLVFVLLL